MSDIYYKFDGSTLRLTNNDGAPVSRHEDGLWPWEDCGGITKVVIDGPIQLPPDSSYLFAGMFELATIVGLENLDTSQASSFHAIFRHCEALTSLDLSGWDTRNVTDMSRMFCGCYNLASIGGIDEFDTDKVTDMSHMFADCHSITSLDLSNWDVSNVTDMSLMFADCDSLTSLDLSGFDTSHVTDMSYMFLNCPSLQSVTTADQRIIAELPHGVHFEAPTAQAPSVSSEASKAVSIEGEPSEPKPQTR